MTATLDFGVKDVGAECLATLDFVEQHRQMDCMAYVRYYLVIMYMSYKGDSNHGTVGRY